MRKKLTKTVLWRYNNLEIGALRTEERSVISGLIKELRLVMQLDNAKEK